EDGIRDRNVTGVQTCALPISPAPPFARLPRRLPPPPGRRRILRPDVPPARTARCRREGDSPTPQHVPVCARRAPPLRAIAPLSRSEERRVGKEWRSLRASGAV